MENNKRVPFTLGYEALTLLGKGMYSNLWAALSELIANGIDAHAKKVDVYIDMSDKAHSTIEILDDGDGMNDEEIEHKYVVIGNNKREGSNDANLLMGRKGVGKLAALFLTRKFEFITKKENRNYNIWQFDFLDRSNKEPSLVKVEKADFVMRKAFDEHKKGTLLKLHDVNLTNMAEEAIKGLSLIMANYFIYENLPGVVVNFYTKTSIEQCIDFLDPITMKKQIAFKNMLSIVGDEKILKKVEGSQFKYPLEYGEYFDSDHLVKQCKTTVINNIQLARGIYTVEIDGDNLSIPYELKGWIGIHASISQEEVRKNNDENFVKNKYYNPNKLRLYIRNKLAVEDFTGYLKNTQQGINYIEGEISFDLLDDNRLDDITTSNRQDVDIHDPRVALLISIVKKIVGQLIADRNDLTQEANKENKRRKRIIETEAKKHARKTIKNDLSGMGIERDKLDDVLSVIDNKFKGDNDLKAKEIYKLFISHSKRDRRFSDFIYNLLIKKGAKEGDIFYTTHHVGAGKDLSKSIKDNISENNVLVLFLDSVNFNRSQYCLFEGGAYWATRSVEDCIHLHFDASWIPDYINDRKKYHVPINEGRKLSMSAFELTVKKYKELTEVLNIVIDHLNNSATHTSTKIQRFGDAKFPSDVDMKKDGKTPMDYMDGDFVDYWKYYVLDGETDKKDDGTKRTISDFREEYNLSVDKM